MKKYLFKTIIIILCLTIGVAVPICAKSEYTNVEAKVVENHGTTQVKQDNETVQEVQNVTIRILEGEYEDEEHNAQYILSDNVENKNSKDALEEENRILVNIQEDEGEITSIVVQEIIKQYDITYIILLFIVLLIVIGRKKGIKPIIISILTVLAIYFILINSISKGWNLLLMSVVTSLVIQILTSIIINGIGRKSTIVVLSSIIGVGISGVIAFVYFKITQISGNILNVSIDHIHLDIKQILYSGVILSSTGICLYISSTIATYLENIKKEDKSVGWKQLTKMGIDEGMNQITNIVSIPILLYLCSAITLIAIVTSNNSHNETIAIIIEYLVNICVGGIITVPVIAFKIFFKTKSDNIIEGQRSLKL